MLAIRIRKGGSMKLRRVFCLLPAAVLTGFMLFVVLGCATGGTARG